jgi:hypothetical protein
MKTASVIFLALAMVVCTVPALSQDISNEAFYQDCLNKVINKYENKAQNLASERPAIKRDAAVSCLKAAYFKSHKERLVNDMCAQDIAPERAKVDYFLTKSFGQHMGDKLEQAVADVMTEGSAKEVFEAYSEPKN